MYFRTTSKVLCNNRLHWRTIDGIPELIAQIEIMNQMQIIVSLSSRIDSVLHDVTGHLFAELQESELLAATQLKKSVGEQPVHWRALYSKGTFRE